MKTTTRHFYERGKDTPRHHWAGSTRDTMSCHDMMTQKTGMKQRLYELCFELYELFSSNEREYRRPNWRKRGQLWFYWCCRCIWVPTRPSACNPAAYLIKKKICWTKRWKSYPIENVFLYELCFHTFRDLFIDNVYKTIKQIFHLTCKTNPEDLTRDKVSGFGKFLD